MHKWFTTVKVLKSENIKNDSQDTTHHVYLHSLFFVTVKFTFYISLRSTSNWLSYGYIYYLFFLLILYTSTGGVYLDDASSRQSRIPPPSNVFTIIRKLHHWRLVWTVLIRHVKWDITQRIVSFHHCIEAMTHLKQRTHETQPLEKNN